MDTKPSERILKWFTYAHLPDHLQAVSKEFSDLAAKIDALVPESPEKTVGLRKLLEAKDCFVRARIELEADIQQGRKWP